MNTPELAGSRASEPRAVFFVVDRPFSVWADHLSGDNERFLNALDAGFYEKLAKQQGRRNLENEKIRLAAASQLRLFWHHSIETMICLIGASLQAPTCVFGYMCKCSNSNVREIAQSLQDEQPLKYVYGRLKTYSWEGYFRAVFSYTKWLADRSDTVDFFARSTKEMCASYLSPDHALEYNSLKHGMRLSTGPATLKMGNQEGEFDREGSLTLHSRDSSYFIDLTPVPGLSKEKSKVHYQVERVVVGWSLERTIQDIQLVSMIIRNVVSLIKCTLGAPPKTVKFHRPQMDKEWIDTYFKRRPELANFHFRQTFNLDPERAESAAELKAAHSRMEQ